MKQRGIYMVRSVQDGYTYTPHKEHWWRIWLYMPLASIPCALVATSSSIRRAAKATAGALISIYLLLNVFSFKVLSSCLM
jgi:hypothetical protein